MSELPALPAAIEAIAAYLASMAATYGGSALRRRLSAIGGANPLAGYPWNPGHPAVRSAASCAATAPRPARPLHSPPPRSAWSPDATAA